MPPSSPSRNRWYSIFGFQFSRMQVIRAAQVLAVATVLFIGAFSAWYLPPRTVARQIRSVGGYVEYEYEQIPNVALAQLLHRQFRSFGLSPIDSHVTEAHLHSTPVTDQWIYHLKPLDRLQRLSVHERQLGPGLADLASARELSTVSVWHLCSGNLGHLSQLPKLTQLILVQSDCANIDLSALVSIPTLNHLEFQSGAVTARLLEQLSQVKSLYSLGLTYAKLDTDAMQGLAHLAALPNLQNLQISDPTPEAAELLARIESLAHLSILRSQLADNDLAVLTKLPRLRSLRLEQSSHPIDIESLRKAMPQCRIDYVGPGSR